MAEMLCCDFSVDDAQEWGSADIAAILFSIRSQLRENAANEKHLHDGRVWTCITPEAWSSLFPWLSDVIRDFTKRCRGGVSGF